LLATSLAIGRGHFAVYRFDASQSIPGEAEQRVAF
jgi:hypothetical protein